MIIQPQGKVPTRIWLLANKVAMAFPEQVPGVLEIKWRKSRKKVHKYRGGGGGDEARVFTIAANKTSGGTTTCFGFDAAYGSRCALARIIVTAGTDYKDAKMVFLHEMAHAMTPGHNHDKVFWDKAFELYRWAKLPMLYCRKREIGYKKGALAAYRRNRKSAAMKGTE